MEDRMPMVDNMGEQHIACVLLVDVSGSMGGNRLLELKEGLRAFGSALQQDMQARGCTDVCVISFSDSVQTEIPFCPASGYNAPEWLTAGGLTSLNQAILAGLEAIEERKSLYKSLGVSYYRPWMFLLTDGAPTDNEYEGVAKQKLSEAINGKKVIFFPMGIGENADMAKLASYSGGRVMRATAEHFKDAFVWVSNSISVVANSFQASKVDLPPTPEGIQIEIL